MMRSCVFLWDILFGEVRTDQLCHLEGAAIGMQRKGATRVEASAEVRKAQRIGSMGRTHSTDSLPKIEVSFASHRI